MIRVIRCNFWVLLLRGLCGLRVGEGSAAGLMDMFGFEVEGLRYLFHSIKLDTRLGFDALHGLIRNRKYPFREIYLSGCDILMDLKRIREIRWANGLHLGTVLPQSCPLISPECLSRLSKLTSTILKHVRSSDILCVFPVDVVSPIYHDETLLIDEIITATNLDQDFPLQPENFPALLQNCNWFYYDRASYSLHRRSAFMTFANRSAWKVFHHSCYQVDRMEKESAVKRLHQSIKGLVMDDPVMLVHFALLHPYQIAKVLRWSVHLALIMLTNLTVKDGTGDFVADPIRDYFTVLQRKSSMLNEPTWILKKLLKACTNHYANTRVVTPTAVLSSSFLPPEYKRVKELVLDDVPKGESHNRFHLDLLLLYSRFNDNLLEEHPEESSVFLLATPIEQWQIIKEHLESVRKHLHFLRPAMIQVIRVNWRLQRRLLNQFASTISWRSHKAFQLIIESVPLDVRVKYARWRFLKNKKQIRRLRFLCRNHRTVSSQVNSYINHLISKKCLSRNGTVYRIMMMDGQKMALLSFMINVAFVFGCRIPVIIDPKQLMLILGYNDASVCAFEGPGYNISEYFDHSEDSSSLKNYDAVQEAVTMSQSMIPILFTWTEFISILQPIQLIYE